MTYSASDIAQLIDHTYLKSDATQDEIQTLCAQAREFGFATVCIPPSFVSFASEQLLTSQVKVCTVVGFPLGYTETQVKAFEAQCAIEQGAQEIDMVMNIAAFKSRKFELVEMEIRAVVESSQGALVKVILETCLLSPEEIELACKIAENGKAHFVKTSTGFSHRGALVDEVKIMRQSVTPKMQVKASGGIRSLSDLIKMIEAGATRIGTSAGVQILAEVTNPL